MNSKQVTEKALALLRYLPRVSMANIRDNPGSKRTNKRGRGQHGGDTHGDGAKGHNNIIRLGYETGNLPFFLRFPREQYYKGEHLRREYPPVSLLKLQKMIDTNRIDVSRPIDLTTIIRTGLYDIWPDKRQFGVNLVDEGADIFSAKVNIEVQWTNENVIAAIERNGGVITTAYYDQHSLQIMRNPEKFFHRGVAIPRRMIPPPDAAEYYGDASKRGYLSDPEKVSEERLVLAQKFGYILPKIEDDPDYDDLLTMRKDPRQIFYGLDPGWVVNLRDRVILKPETKKLLDFYAS